MVPKSPGVRTERYKPIENWEQDPRQYKLYDLQNDPGGRHNLYGETQYAGLTQELMKRLYDRGRDMGEI